MIKNIMRSCLLIYAALLYLSLIFRLRSFKEALSKPGAAACCLANTLVLAAKVFLAPDLLSTLASASLRLTTDCKQTVKK